MNIAANTVAALFRAEHSLRSNPTFQDHSADTPGNDWSAAERFVATDIARTL